LEATMRAWQIQEAKAHLSELVRETEHAGPQAITWHGREVAVVLSKAEYERLTGTGQSLVEFMRSSPLFGAEDIDLRRDPSLTRDVTL
jgi:prevent-host-death family protein